MQGPPRRPYLPVYADHWFLKCFQLRPNSQTQNPLRVNRYLMVKIDNLYSTQFTMYVCWPGIKLRTLFLLLGLSCSLCSYSYKSSPFVCSLFIISHLFLLPFFFSAQFCVSLSYLPAFCVLSLFPPLGVLAA